MSVYRPASSKVWWYDFIFEGQRVRESAKTRSKTIAKDAEKVALNFAILGGFATWREPILLREGNHAKSRRRKASQRLIA